MGNREERACTAPWPDIGEGSAQKAVPQRIPTGRNAENQHFLSPDNMTEGRRHLGDRAGRKGSAAGLDTKDDVAKETRVQHDGEQHLWLRPEAAAKGCPKCQKELETGKKTYDGRLP